MTTKPANKVGRRIVSKRENCRWFPLDEEYTFPVKIPTKNCKKVYKPNGFKG